MKASSVFFRLVSLSVVMRNRCYGADANRQAHYPFARQRAADQASRDQLAAYLADFQSHPDDAALRDKIIELAKSLNPAPEIPQRAQDDFAKATAQMAAASSADDF